MHSWQSGGVDFDGFIGGKKDYNFVVIGVVVVVSVFCRERGWQQCERGEVREVQRDEKGMAQQERGVQQEMGSMMRESMKRRRQRRQL